MTKSPIVAGLAALAAAIAVPVIAQNDPAPALGTKDTSRVLAGSYAADASHSLVAWEVTHFGFNPYHGLITGISGTLTIDPANLAAASVEVTVPLAPSAPYPGITGGNATLDKHLAGADFFDVAKFPTATFKSTRVILDDDGDEAKIEGNLTIKGVTRTVVLDADFVGAGPNPFNKKETIGFEAEATLKRSDFGITHIVPLVSDEVKLKITAAFEKQ